MIDAIAAVDAIGIGSRVEFHAALSAIFVKRHEDQPVFDEAFSIFWRSRDLVGKMIQLMSPVAAIGERQKPKAGGARVSDALFATANASRNHATSRMSRLMPVSRFQVRRCFVGLISAR